jgi:biopolymer transport protein ExbB
MDVAGLTEFLARGGPALWTIAALSVATLTLILWKLWRLARAGAWAGRRTEAALTEWCAGRHDAAEASLAGRSGLRARLARAAMRARRSGRLTEAEAREETARVAKALLRDARSGLRALELIATIAPLIGLLGTVLGMIAAFQALQQSGNQADPSILAGGIWEALLTTAAGMAVAIPASMALTWFESVADRVQADMEDAATRIFTAPAPPPEATARAA